MSVEALLEVAAFGDQPGRWPLPAAATPRQLWLRAVAAGGQGRYGSASADLVALRRAARSGLLASLTHSTQASFLRQLGGHAAARSWDGRAAALAGADVQAGVDALLGLAADALGVGRFAASAALLDRAHARLHASASADRLPIRWQWVAAELAMARGEGVAAVRHAERAVELAAVQPSLRHRAKSEVVHAAALCASGRLDQACSVAENALLTTGKLGLIPLRWAVASLLVDISSDTGAATEVAAIRDACAETVRRAGGVWRR
jgi:hypothetical protein